MRASREGQRCGRGGKEREDEETCGPGWCIVRSIVRLLYLVPSFCGSLSHPSLSFISLPPELTFVYVAYSPLAPVLIPVFSPRPSFPYLTTLPFLNSSLSLFFLLCFLSFSFVHVLSPFLGLFPLSATQHYHRLGAVTSSSQSPLRDSERKRRKEMKV